MNQCLTIGHLLSKPTLYHFPIGFFGSSIIFILYLELSPKIGNIWYRVESDGKKRVNLRHLLHFLSKPFKDRLFWHPKMYDLNWITFTLAGTLLYAGIRRSFES